MALLVCPVATAFIVQFQVWNSAEKATEQKDEYLTVFHDPFLTFV